MVIRKILAALALAITILTGHVTHGQDSDKSGIIEAIDASSRTVLISGTQYRFDGSTTLTNDENRDESNIGIKDFSVGSVVEFSARSSGILRYLRIYLP